MIQPKKLKRFVGPLLRAWKLGVGVAALFLMIVWTGGACRKKIAPGLVKHEPGFAVPADAARITVQTEDVAPRIDVVGTVASAERIHLSARVPAYVSEVLASAGDVVKRGQDLVRLDDRAIREQLSAAEAQLKQAEREFARTRELYATQAATQQQLQAAEAAHSSAKANVAGVKVMLTYTRITSPINGIVTDRTIEKGDLANPGRVILSVYDPTKMRLEAAVPVRLVDRLQKGQQVPVTLDYPSGTMTGHVSEIVSEVDAASRTRTVKIRIEDPPANVLPGAFGRVWVDGDTHRAVLVPDTAVYRVGQLDMVQVVKGTRATVRLVRKGPRHGEKVEILSGLDDGATILATPIRGE